MKTRQQSKKGKESSVLQGSSHSRSLHESDTLTDISREAVGKLLRRADSRSSPRFKRQDDRHRSENGIPESGLRSCSKQNVNTSKFCGANVGEHALLEKQAEEERGEEMDEPEWEDGSVPISDSIAKHSSDCIKEVTVEFNVSPDSVKRKPVRRASAEDKELAELVHKVNLLCLLGRGRLIDTACDDPLIQASLLSIVPRYLLKISGVSNLSAKELAPIVSWFHENFHVRSPSSEERSFPSALALALESREGTAEEVTALSVALFRALNLTSRFVSILDVVPLKPGAEKSEISSQTANRAVQGIFSSSTPMVQRPKQASASPLKMTQCNEKDEMSEISTRGGLKRKYRDPSGELHLANERPTDDQPQEKGLDSLASEVQSDNSKACPIRKGDIEFEMQLEMALSATAVGDHGDDRSSDGISTAVGAKKVGAPLYWAEVYCSGENLTGKWVHVDAVNSIIDGEQNVEAAAAACRTSLRYVVAFAGYGAKDVTRRYCMKWYKIASQRVSSTWWDMVLAPLKELESGATTGDASLPKRPDEKLFEENSMTAGAESSTSTSLLATRSSIEDLELDTRALTEPLPTNQQAYKNHQLYALERWLTKYQILHPKGPVLGFCSGHPVYPRSCVQTLKTRDRWLREALQVKANELPAKVLNCPSKLDKVEVDDAADDSEGIRGGMVALYGKWQLEPLCLPRAANGLVPKNERGQVDVWSEKCLPPGTVHLRLPRVGPVAKRLEIDYAPAMVGFDFQNGRSIPVFDGIVVCSEFKDAILEAYAEEEERRVAAEKKRNEVQAINRWYQLLSSIVTRQRLSDCYRNDQPSQALTGLQEIKSHPEFSGSGSGRQILESARGHIPDINLYAPSTGPTEDHEHVFFDQDQCFDEDNLVRTKRCRCGFSVEVEEL